MKIPFADLPQAFTTYLLEEMVKIPNITERQAFVSGMLKSYFFLHKPTRFGPDIDDDAELVLDMNG